MSNKVLTTSKYSYWDRCQGLGRGCNCAYGQARSLSTFEEYSQEMILPYTTSQLETVSRVDIVWDKYLYLIYYLYKKPNWTTRSLMLNSMYPCINGIDTIISVMKVG